MKLNSSEVRGESEGDIQLDIVNKTIDSRSKLEKSESKSCTKSDNIMGKTKSVTVEASVNEIINGVQSCKIAENVPAHEIMGQMGKLTLENVLNVEVKEKPEVQSQQTEITRKEEEKASRKEEGKAEDEKTEVKEKPVECLLIRLPAPSSDESDNEETSDNDSDEREGGSLTDRGPMHGIPSTGEIEGGQSYMSKPVHDNFNNLNAGPCLNMPQNFPNYEHYNQTQLVMNNCKRLRDRDFTYEPPKFVKPELAGDNLLSMNNLNAPGNSSSVSEKKVNVCQRQMSGGTMQLNDNIVPCSANQIMNEMIGTGASDSSIPPGLWKYSNIPTNANLVDILIDNDTVPQLYTEAYQRSGYPMNPLSQQQQPNLQGSLPPVSTLTHPGTPVKCQEYSTQQQLYDISSFLFEEQQAPLSGIVKQSSFSYDDYGYSSDLSPLHETQSPPTPSPPQNICAASPGSMVFGSPPSQHNWSPPPSNQSNCSTDSGVGSPTMSDDQHAYTSLTLDRMIDDSQVKSPRHTFAVSPPGRMSQGGGKLSTSPPQHQVMSPAQAVMPPPHQQMSSYHQAMSPPRPGMSPVFHQALGSSMSQVSEMSEDGGYVSRYITNNLGELSLALEIAHEDLKKGMYKKLPSPTSTPVGSSKGVANAQKGNNSISSEKNGLNLPTTIPVTFSPVSSISHPLDNNDRQVHQKTSISSSVPPGKIAISPLPQRTPTTGKSGSMVPVLVMTSPNKDSASYVIVPIPSITTKPTPRYALIAPKDPTKQGDKPGDNKGISHTPSSPLAAGGESSGNRGDKNANGGSANGKRTSPTTLLNLARRLVAEMSTKDLQFIDRDADSYLHVAVCKADHFMVQALLERLVREKLADMIDLQNSMGQTPLYLAVSTNNHRMVQLLVEQGADANPFAECELPSGAREKSAAIHCASSKGDKHLETLKALLKAPEINLNQVNSDGHTALHCAILAHGKVDADRNVLNSIPIIQALIPSGADPNLQVQQSGKTALMYALESRDLDLIESIFQLIDPSKLPAYLKTQAFDGSNCFRIADSLKSTLDPASQQRLYNYLKPRHMR